MKLISTFALSAVLLLTSCASEPVEPTTPEPTPEVTTPEVTENTFTSEELGFQLTFPETWETTSTVEETTWAFGTTQTVYFKKAGSGSDIFAVTRFTKEEWAEVVEKDMIKPTVLEEEGDYVWTYDTTQDPADVDDYVQALPEVLKTFKATL